MESNNILSSSLVSCLWHNYSISTSTLIELLLLNVFKRLFHPNMHITSLPILKDEFQKEYSLHIPHINIPDILHKSKYVSKNDEYYTLDTVQLETDYPDLVQNTRGNGINEEVKKLKQYLHSEFNIDIAEDEIRNKLNHFLENNGMYILNSLTKVNNVDLGEVEEMDRLIASYIAKCDVNSLSHIFDVFIGVIVSRILGLYLNDQIHLAERELKVLDNCTMYLDTPILIPLLGASEESYTKMYEELVAIFRKSGAKIKTFSHIVNEVEKILTSSLKWIQTNQFNVLKANRAAKYFFFNQDRLPHLQMLVDDLEGYIKSELGIEVESIPINHEFEKYCINETILEENILEIYTNNQYKEYFEELRYQIPIQADVQSINQINILRKGIVPNSIREYKHILITKNWGLVKATKKYADRAKDGTSLNWSILIDSNLSSVLWNIQNKPLLNDYFKYKLLSDCVSIISPSPRFLQEFVSHVREYALRKNLDENHVQHMLLKIETSTQVYLRCGEDYGCIIETLEELQKKRDASLTEPLEDRIKELSEVKEELEISIKDKISEIIQVKTAKEEREREKEEVHNQLEQKKKEVFYLTHRTGIILRFVFQLPPWLEIVVALLGVLAGFLGKYILAGISVFVLLIAIVFFKLYHAGGKKYSEVKDMYIIKYYKS